MSVERLRKLREDFRRTPDSYVHELRLSFAETVIDRLKELRWSQRELCKKLGVTEPLVSRLLNGDHNWTSKSAGRILFALGVRARVRAEPVPKEEMWQVPAYINVHRSDGTQIAKPFLIGIENGETTQEISYKTDNSRAAV